MFDQDDKAELTRLEEAMWRTETRFDLVFQEARFAPDFVEFGRSGRVYNRVQIIRTDKHPIEASLRNLRFAELDQNTVLVTYNSVAVFDDDFGKDIVARIQLLDRRLGERFQEVEFSGVLQSGHPLGHRRHGVQQPEGHPCVCSFSLFVRQAGRCHPFAHLVGR